MVDALPKFKQPPLVEVLHGVGFSRLAMTTLHPGLFYHWIRDRYPQAHAMPPLPFQEESFGFGLPGFNIVGMMPSIEIPRTWYVSSDDLLVQMQSDQLYLNWRRGVDGSYPHFDQVSGEFERVFGLFRSFAEQQQLGSPIPLHGEMTYVNHIASETPDRLPPPHDLFRVWSNDIGPEWGEALDDVSFKARYVLRDATGRATGRLSASLGSMVYPDRVGRYYQLDITARGKLPENSAGGLRQFHADAHSSIVRCFAAMTTPDAHDMWGRYQ